MRVMPITNNNMKKNPSYIRANVVESLSLDKNVRDYNSYYYPMISFGNDYSKDKEIITKSISALNLTLDRTRAYYSEDNIEMLNALELLENKSLDLYNQLISDENRFKTHLKNFNDFSDTILYSLDNIQSGVEKMGSYFIHNSKIGDKNTIDIINEILHLDNIESIPQKLTCMDYSNYSEIRNNLIIEWFKEELKEKTTELDKIKISNKELEAELNTRLGQLQTKKIIINAISNSLSEFKNMTIDKIFKENVSDTDRLTAVYTLLDYLEICLKEATNSELEVNLDTILNVHKQLDYAKNRETLSSATHAFSELYQIAIKHWKEHELPYMINKELRSNLIIYETELKFQQIKSIPGYDELSTDSKAFVANYYCKTNNTNNNLLNQIIKDRNILNPSPIIEAMNLKIINDRNYLFSNIDNFYEILHNEQELLEKSAQLTTPQRKNQLSILNHFILILDGSCNLFYKPNTEQIKYLSTISKEELRLAGNEIKRNWIDNEQKYAIETEVRRQANLTSINQKMYEELKNININLNDIKIQVNDISYTLKDIIDNKATIKGAETPDIIIQEAYAKISEAQRAYSIMTPQNQAIADKKMQEVLPVIIDNVSKNTTNTKLLEQLSLAKSKCKTSPRAARDTFNMLKTIISGRLIVSGFDGCKKGVTSLLGKTHYSASLASTTVTTAGTTSSSAGLLNSIPIEPITAAIVASLAVAASVVVAGNNATKAERAQRPIYVEFQY